MIIFLVITVGLPTCLGLGGTLIGVLASIFAIVLSFVIRIFVH